MREFSLDPRPLRFGCDFSGLPFRSKHPVVVLHLPRDLLSDVPVLRNPSILNAKDVYNRTPEFPRLHDYVDVRNHKIPVDKHALDDVLCAGRYTFRPTKKLLQPLGPRANDRIMLDIVRCKVFIDARRIEWLQNVLIDTHHQAFVHVILAFTGHNCPVLRRLQSAGSDVAGLRRASG